MIQYTCSMKWMNTTYSTFCFGHNLYNVTICYQLCVYIYIGSRQNPQVWVIYWWFTPPPPKKKKQKKHKWSLFKCILTCFVIYLGRNQAPKITPSHLQASCNSPIGIHISWKWLLRASVNIYLIKLLSCE